MFPVIGRFTSDVNLSTFVFADAASLVIAVASFKISLFALFTWDETDMSSVGAS
jgi:hypothetical protein